MLLGAELWVLTVEPEMQAAPRRGGYEKCLLSELYILWANSFFMICDDGMDIGPDFV